MKIKFPILILGEIPREKTNIKSKLKKRQQILHSVPRILKCTLDFGANINLNQLPLKGVGGGIEKMKEISSPYLEGRGGVEAIF